jgi:Uncharacterized protein related to glutamine synthetase
MDLMNKMATKHNFIVLFHEKPFEKLTVPENTPIGLW